MGKNNVLKIFRFACLLCIIGFGLTAIGCSGECEMDVVGSVDMSDEIHDVHVSGSYAYMSEWDEVIRRELDVLKVIDICD